MKKRMCDVLPGEVFEMASSIGERCLFLKLRDQKVVNLTTSYLCRINAVEDEVEVKQHPLDSYLMFGGIDKG